MVWVFKSRLIEGTFFSKILTTPRNHVNKLISAHIVTDKGVSGDLI